MTALGTAPRVADRDGVVVAVKTFPAADTATYKCWGSGHTNERHAARALGDAVPEVVETWSDADADHLSYRWVAGEPFGGASDEDRVRAARDLLARISGTVGPWWGSLDGCFVFPDGVAALADRWSHAMRLLHRVDADLAIASDRWGERVLGVLEVPGPPRLVHGDYGPGNLVATSRGLVVVDWEHARWGHPAEDWAKIALGRSFAEPNAFPASFGRSDEYEGTAGLLLTFLSAYYAACLGVFFAGRPEPRHAYLRSLVTRGGGA